MKQIKEPRTIKVYVDQTFEDTMFQCETCDTKHASTEAVKECPECGQDMCPQCRKIKRKYDTSEVFEFCDEQHEYHHGYEDTTYTNGWGIKLLEGDERRVCKNCFGKIDYFGYDQKALALLNETRIKMKELNKEFFGEE